MATREGAPAVEPGDLDAARAGVDDMEVTHVINSDSKNGLVIRIGARGDVRYLELRVPDGRRSFRVETVPGQAARVHKNAEDMPFVLVVDRSRPRTMCYRQGEVYEEGSSAPFVDRELHRVFAHRLAPYSSLDPDIRGRIEAVGTPNGSDPAADQLEPRGFSSWLSCMSDSIGVSAGLGTTAGAIGGGAAGATAGAVLGAAFGSGFGLGYCTTTEVLS